MLYFSFICFVNSSVIQPFCILIAAVSLNKQSLLLISLSVAQGGLTLCIFFGFYFC